MTITEDRIADALTNAPAWALIGLTAPRETLRHDAANEVAHHLIAALSRPPAAPAGQMALPL